MIAQNPQSVQNPPTSLTVSGFTMIFDEVVAQHGLVVAAVFGVIWRNCQKNRHVCDASHDTLATATGLSRRTIIRSTKHLVDAGLVILHDERKGKGQRTYTISPNFIVHINIGTETTVTESHSNDELGVTESHSRCDRESQQKGFGVTESHTKKQYKKQSKKQQQPAIVVADLQEEFDRLNSHLSDPIYANNRTGKLPLETARAWANYAESGGDLPPTKALICMIEREQAPPTNGTTPKENWQPVEDFEL